MISLIILLVLFGIALIIIGMIACVDDYEFVGCASVALGSAFIMIAIEQKIQENVPKAIDVYRGNTTLKITYQDSIPIDTVVVFKNNK